MSAQSEESDLQQLSLSAQSEESDLQQLGLSAQSEGSISNSACQHSLKGHTRLGETRSRGCRFVKVFEAGHCLGIEVTWAGGVVMHTGTKF